MSFQEAKYESQVQLVARLREFEEPLSAGYSSEQEFFITVVQSMNEHLLELKKEVLAEVCARFSSALDKGVVPEETIIELKSSLDKLVSVRDYEHITGSLAGSRQLLKSRLAALKPLSIEAEERKGAGMDKAAFALVSTAYKRLQFDALEKEIARDVSGPALHRMLVKAKANVAEYCCLYRLPLNPAETLTPFSISRIEAVTGACFRLLTRIREARARNA